MQRKDILIYRHAGADGLDAVIMAALPRRFRRLYLARRLIRSIWADADPSKATLVFESDDGRWQIVSRKPLKVLSYHQPTPSAV